jgi:hypothetical protein
MARSRPWRTCRAARLGLELLGADELLACSSHAGLLAVALDDGRVRTLTDRVAGEPLGTISFTDSSTPLPGAPLAR